MKLTNVTKKISLSDIARKMLMVVCIAPIALILASVVYYRSFEFLSFAYGVLLGTVLNVVKIIILDRTVSKVIGMEAVAAGNYVRIQHLIRLLLTGLVLILAVFVPFINLYGAAAGVLLFHFAVLLTRRSSNQKKEG